MDHEFSTANENKDHVPVFASCKVPVSNFKCLKKRKPGYDKTVVRDVDKVSISRKVISEGFLSLTIGQKGHLQNQTIPTT